MLVASTTKHLFRYTYQHFPRNLPDTAVSFSKRVKIRMGYGQSVPCGMSLSSQLVYSKQPIFGLTQEWFRELSFSRLECGVDDKLHIYPLCGIFYFPWHKHQIEGTNGFRCLIRKAQIYTASNVESQVFTRNNSRLLAREMITDDLRR